VETGSCQRVLAVRRLSRRASRGVRRGPAAHRQRPDHARPRQILPARAGPRGTAPPDRGPAIRQGDPDRGRLIHPAARWT
jgi:hypothetical protein